MTGGAALEVGELRRFARRVAGGAGGRPMLAGEWIARPRVIEVGGLDPLPVVGSVAALALRPTDR